MPETVIVAGNLDSPLEQHHRGCIAQHQDQEDLDKQRTQRGRTDILGSMVICGCCWEEEEFGSSTGILDFAPLLICSSMKHSSSDPLSAFSIAEITCIWRDTSVFFPNIMVPEPSSLSSFSSSLINQDFPFAVSLLLLLLALFKSICMDHVSIRYVAIF